MAFAPSSTLTVEVRLRRILTGFPDGGWAASASAFRLYRHYISTAGKSKGKRERSPLFSAPPAPDQLQQHPVDRLRGRHIAVPVDVAAPPGPVLLQRLKGVKPAGVHVLNAVLLLKVPKELCKPRPGVGQTGGGGQSGARADDDGVSSVQRLSQLFDPLPGGRGRWQRLHP